MNEQEDSGSHSVVRPLVRDEKSDTIGPKKNAKTIEKQQAKIETDSKRLSTESSSGHQDSSLAPANAVQEKNTTKAAFIPIPNLSPVKQTSKVMERFGKIIKKQQPVNASDLVRLNQHVRYDNITLRIPTPVFLASLPKSGTTSIWKYFLCGGVNASHFYVKLNETEVTRFGDDVKDSTFAGRCMHANVLSGQPLLENCGRYQVWTDTGYIKGKPAIKCYYPAIEGLDELYKWYPNATLLYITRQTDDWTQSVSRWSMGTLLRRWKRCNLTGLINTTFAGMNAFYDWHKALVRNFAKTHPSLTYIEAALEDPETGFLLEDATGIPASCWADCNPHTRQCRTIK
jgi:hypothetical protein